MATQEIMFIGNFNNALNKEVVNTLKREYTVQLFNGTANIFDRLLDISVPSFVFISLVAQNDNVKEMMLHISKHYPALAVVTLASKSEAQEYNTLYDSDQFVNILRPVSADAIFDECRQTMVRASFLKIRAEEGDDDDEEGSGISSFSNKKKIMVVDDNQMMLRNLKDMLGRQYEVTMANSGSQAITLLEKKKIDLILLDYEMPIMNGRQVYQILQDSEEYRDIPVIFLTGISSNEKVIEVLKLRPAGYILKPPDVDVLFEKIEEVIGF